MISVEQRARERRGAAALRAVGARPDAELRGSHVVVGDQVLPVASPHVSTPLVDHESLDDVAHRGLVDAMGVRLRYSDAALHRSLEPDDIVPRLVFDLLEQLRCESLVPPALEGVRWNIERAFRRWSDHERLTETSLGLLIFTVLHVVRSRLVQPLQNEHIEDAIEATRANISPLIGSSLRALRASTHDQAAYAIAALELAATVGSMVDAEQPSHTSEIAAVEASLFIPPEWGDDDDDTGDRPGGVGVDLRVDDRPLDAVGGYHVFTRAHDDQVSGADLYDRERLDGLREDLDARIGAQSVSVYAIAKRLRRIFGGPVVDGWRHGLDEGLLDAARLPQLVANPARHDVFRQERHRLTAPVVVSFLVDTSGSMKRQRFEAAAVLIDTLARAIDLAGGASEILGFTTRSWNGGAALRDWRRAGQPADPGRLAEVRHIVYKDADTSWRKARRSVAAMLRTQHFREGVDGEAIAWAYQRLLARPEPRRILVVVTDGAPMEAATMNANGEAFLDAHLRNVVRRIERERLVDIGALAIDLPVDECFTRSVALDLEGTLALSSYRTLEDLFR